MERAQSFANDCNLLGAGVVALVRLQHECNRPGSLID